MDRLVKRDEQEVIISYDRYTDKWHYYGDVPPLNRRWDKLVNADRRQVINGKIAFLEGDLKDNANVILAHKPKYSDAERARRSKLAKKLKRDK